jgi:hypothetical protein
MEEVGDTWWSWSLDFLKIQANEVLEELSMEETIRMNE